MLGMSYWYWYDMAKRGEVNPRVESRVSINQSISQSTNQPAMVSSSR